MNKAITGRPSVARVIALKRIHRSAVRSLVRALVLRRAGGQHGRAVASPTCNRRV